MFTAFCAAIFAAGQTAHVGPHRVVFEVDEPDQHAYETVLGHAEHVKKAFAPETVEIEVVCHADGIQMLFPNGRLAKRIAADAKAGVIFAACANTMKGRHLTTKNLYPFAKVVPSGVAEVVRKQEAGWAYIK